MWIFSFDWVRRICLLLHHLLARFFQDVWPVSVFWNIYIDSLVFHIIKIDPLVSVTIRQSFLVTIYVYQYVLIVVRFFLTVFGYISILTLASKIYNLSWTLSRVGLIHRKLFVLFGIIIVWNKSLTHIWTASSWLWVIAFVIWIH